MRRSCARIALGLAAALATVVSPALADYKVERELSLAPGGELFVDSAGGGIEIRVGSAPEVRVTITSRYVDLERAFDFQFEEQADRVVLRSRGHGKRGRLLERDEQEKDVKWKLVVPERTRLDIETDGGTISVTGTRGDASLRTSGGAILVNDLEGDLQADTAGGSIRVETVRGSVSADTSGGGIHIADVDGGVRADTSGGAIQIVDVRGDVRAGASGGSIRAERIGGRVDAETSGGSIQAAFAPGNSWGGELITSGGGVRVKLDAGAHLDLDVAVSGGSITAGVPVVTEDDPAGDKLRGSLGSGGERLTIRASGGPVTIEPL